MTAVGDRAYDDISLSSMAFWARTWPERDAELEELRATRPVSWQAPTENSLAARGPGAGFWAVLDHADIQAVARDATTFCASEGVAIDDVPMDLQERMISFLAMDPPQHTRIRRVVSSAFTPRQIARGDAAIRRRAVQIVDDLLDHGPCDFVERVSSRLPLWTISEMLGIAPHDRPVVARGVEAILGRSDPARYGELDRVQVMIAGLEDLEALARDMAASLRRTPRETLFSNIVHAEVEGQRLSDGEIVATFVLLAMAGHDTTRHTTSIAMKALSDHPDQRRYLAADPPGRLPVAVEEFLRWGSVIINNRRTATVDAVVGDVQVAAGDRVVLFYYYGDRDRAVFEAPYRFDVTREPNPHVAFGGGGTHFCLGASLARAQLRALFGELLTRVPDLEAGDPVYLLSTTINGINAMPCTW